MIHTLIGCFITMASILSFPSGSSSIMWEYCFFHAIATPPFPQGKLKFWISSIESLHLMATSISDKSLDDVCFWNSYSQCSWMQSISAVFCSSAKYMEFPLPSALIVVILIVLSFLEIEWRFGTDPFCLLGWEVWCRLKNDCLYFWQSLCHCFVGCQ